MTNKRIQLSTNVDGQNVNVYPVTKSEFVEFSDGKTLNDKLNNMDGNHEHGLATPAKDGFMSKEDKAKLDGVNNYTHPSTHAATMITEDATHRFVTDAEKTKWDNKADTTMASKTNAGLMSASDKQRIDGLNTEFKTRDDKITKNTEDIKSWNDEMINKEYQYFNGENITIENSIVSKTTDMVIKGNTLQNLIDVKKIILGDSSKEITFQDNIIKFKKAYPNEITYLKVPFLSKPNTTYTIIYDVIKNNVEQPDESKYILYPDGVFGDFNSTMNTFPKNGQTGLNKFCLNTKSTLFGKFSLGFHRVNVGAEIWIKDLMILEGDWTNKEIPDFFEGIKSLGEEEKVEDKYKISILSHGKNLININNFEIVDTTGSIDIKTINESISIKMKKSQGWTTAGVFKLKVKPNTDYIFGRKSKVNTYGHGESTWGCGLITIKENAIQNARSLQEISNPSSDFPSGKGENIKTVKFNTGNCNYIGIFIKPTTAPVLENQLADFIISDLFLYESNNDYKYKIYKEYRKDILIKEPLRKGDYLYEDNGQIKVCRNVKQYTFTGDENITIHQQINGLTRFRVAIPNNSKIDQLAIKFCDNLKINSDDRFFSNIQMSIGTIVAEYQTNNNCYMIFDSDTTTVEQAKIKLKELRPTIVYQLAVSTTEIIENYVDINLKTFKEKTYITSNNVIKGELNLTAPMNTAANLENNSSRLNDIESYIDDNKNNINKISKLEEGAVTSSLNIIDLQKEIKNDSNYIHCEGTNICIDNLSKDSRTSNMIIEGRTLQNLINDKTFLEGVAQYNASTNEYTFSREWDRGGRTSIVKYNTTYTIVALVKSTGSFGLRLDYDVSVNGTTIATAFCAENSAISDYKLYKQAFTTGTNFNNIMFTARTLGGVVNVKNIMILEGDWTNKELPNYFEGIKSSGELEDNNIKILSCGKNLFNPKEFITGERNGVTYVVDNDCIILNGKTKVSDVELISFDNYINIDIDKRYKISYKKISGSTNNDDIRLACKNGSNWIISPANNKNVATIANSSSRKLERIRFFVPENTVFNNFKICIQLEEQDTNTEYEPYVSNLKSILMKEPLRGINNICDIMYQQNMAIKINRNIANFNFKGNETEWQLQSINDHEIANFRMPLNNVKGRNALCDKLIQQSTVIAETTGEGFHVSEGNGIYIRIRKTTASTIDQFKTWLKNNPINIVCDLINPVTEIVGDCLDINFNIYKNKTHIKCLNNISSELNFVIPNNLSTQIKENINHINKNSNSLNLLNDKASNLEAAQLSTALNVLELQKHTSMLDNGEINEYKNHIGTFVECNNTLDSRTENMRIGGRTLVNLVKYRLNNQKVGNPSLSATLCTNEMFKTNTTYTIIYTINSIETGTGKTTLNFSGGMSAPDIILNSSNLVGTHKQTFTLSTMPSVTHKNVSLYHIDRSTVKFFSDVLIVEGEIDFIPSYFEGIKSFGEAEGNKISILSGGLNRCTNESINGFININVNNAIQPDTTAISYIAKVYKGGTYYLNKTGGDRSVLGYFKSYPKIGDVALNVASGSIIVPSHGYIVAYVSSNKNTNNPTNIMISENASADFQPYKSNKKDILIKEPLREGDIMYEDNGQVKVCRKSYEYTLNGENEDWIVWTNSTGDTVNAYVYFNRMTPNLSGIVKPNSSNTNDRLPANQGGYLSTKEGFKITSEYFAISIHKSKLGVTNVNDPNNSTLIKKWLKENPITMICQLATPTIEIIDSIDINVDTYKDKTYITTDNEIQGELEFKTQNNFGAIMKNVNRCISKIFNSLNNILNIKGE